MSRPKRRPALYGEAFDSIPAIGSRAVVLAHTFKRIHRDGSHTRQRHPLAAPRLAWVVGVATVPTRWTCGVNVPRVSSALADYRPEGFARVARVRYTAHGREHLVFLADLRRPAGDAT